MMRRLYALLIRLHPAQFRARYGDEMLWIFDQTRDMHGRRWLISDAVVSAMRQHVMRADAVEEPAVPQSADGIPMFISVDRPLPAAQILMRGAGLATLACACLLMVMKYDVQRRVPNFSFSTDSMWPKAPSMSFAGWMRVPAERNAQPVPAPAKVLRETETKLTPTVLLQRAREAVKLLFRTEPVPKPSEYAAAGQTMRFVSSDSLVKSRDPWDNLTDSLMDQFAKHDVVALGEWHGNEEDAEIRRRLILHGAFAKKVRYVVFECANSLHQATLDRFVSGAEVSSADLQRVWRDVTSPGACDASMYRDFLNEVRALNSYQTPSNKVRVLAADPPINWNYVKSREDWLKYSSHRDLFVADLVSREVLSRHERALVVVGAGHLWQRNIFMKEPNVAELLKRNDPERFYSVIRISGPEEERGRLNAAAVVVRRPVLLPMRQNGVGALPAGEWIGRGILVKLFDDSVRLRDVVDACILTGSAQELPLKPADNDPLYKTEKDRRMELIRPRK